MKRPTPTSVVRNHAMRFGAELTEHSTRFKLWAPKAEKVLIKFKGEPTGTEMEAFEDGWHRLEMHGIKAGARYKYVLPDGMEIPDPASRYQPEDVNGFSEVIDPRAFTWTDTEWIGRPWEETIIYELHVGTFTHGGTFLSAMEKLDHLVELGITAVQLMPLADFYGNFGWGYDGVAWFAPEASYGTPDDLKAFINECHQRGLMVFLDVVYNHFGAHGNYLPAIAPIFNTKHTSPWGDAINFDDEGASVVREFVIENAVYWVTEFHFDGLRFDAVHAIKDDSTTHILEILAARIRSERPLRFTHLILENSENQERWLKRNSSLVPVHYTAQWNDDVHHLLHSAATGENTGYYADFDHLEDRNDMLGRAMAEGFAYQGELKPHEGLVHGTQSGGLPPTSFVVYMQDHDQVGNRIKGDRITEIASIDAVKALASVYLLSPQIPMLFMGEEWASNSPFPFFADVPEDLRDVVMKGRQEELKNTPEHEDPSKANVEDTIDPTLKSTFHSARLDWDALEEEEHANWLMFYRNVIDVRRTEIIPRLHGIGGFSSAYKPIGHKSVIVEWYLADGTTLRLYANLSNEAHSEVSEFTGRRVWLQGTALNGMLGPWSVLWTIELANPYGKTAN